MKRVILGIQFFCDFTHPVSHFLELHVSLNIYYGMQTKGKVGHLCMHGPRDREERYMGIIRHGRIIDSQTQRYVLSGTPSMHFKNGLNVCLQ